MQFRQIKTKSTLHYVRHIQISTIPLGSNVGFFNIKRLLTKVCLKITFVMQFQTAYVLIRH
jgi:hypothetical protein